PGRFEVGYEVSCGYGHNHDVLRPLAARVRVAHPGRLRRIVRSKVKNDCNDAGRLAKLLDRGEAPAVHMPPADVRTWRALITRPSHVTRKRTPPHTPLRARLPSAGVSPPKHPDLWTEAGLAWLRRLELPAASRRLRHDLLLAEVETLTGQLRRIGHQLI